MLWEGGFSASRHAGAGAFPPDGFAPCRSFPLVAAFRVVTVRCTLCLRCAWEAVRTVGGVGASAFAQLRRALRSLPLRAFCLLRESVLVYSMTECGFRGRTCFLVALRISVALRMILSFQILVSKRLLRLALPFAGSTLAGSFGMIFGDAAATSLFDICLLLWCCFGALLALYCLDLSLGLPLRSCPC
jgi:hypothetical protein